MNYDINKDSLSTKKLIFEGCRETPLDVDFTLPDYCPDIQKILKCLVRTNINSRGISGGQINVEGNAQIKILYLDPDSSALRCCENSVPFSSSIDTKINPENAVLHTKIKTEYMNCRAVSPRKIDLHGALSVCAEVYEKSVEEISNEIIGKDIEQKIEKTSVSDLVGIGQQQFSVTETLEVPTNKPAPEMIVNSETIFLYEDLKVMPNKAVVKGKFILKILYISDLKSGNIEKLNYEIPISQIVDVPGITDECQCIVKSEVLSDNVEISNENDSENTEKLLEANIKAALTVFAFEPKESKIVSDVYSREKEVQSNSQVIKTQKIIDEIKENFSHKGSVELPETGAKEIKNIFWNILPVQSYINEENPEFSGKIKLGILGVDQEDSLFYVERNLDFKYKSGEKISEKEALFETEIIPKKITAGAINGNSLEVKADLAVDSVIFKESAQNMITEVSAEDSSANLKNINAPLTLYFAEKGESLWDIARKYHSSVNSIKEENELYEDILNEPQMILVPST